MSVAAVSPACQAQQQARRRHPAWTGIPSDPAECPAPTSCMRSWAHDSCRFRGLAFEESRGLAAGAGDARRPGTAAREGLLVGCQSRRSVSASTPLHQADRAGCCPLLCPAANAWRPPIRHGRRPTPPCPPTRGHAFRLASRVALPMERARFEQPNLGLLNERRRASTRSLHRLRCRRGCPGNRRENDDGGNQ